MHKGHGKTGNEEKEAVACSRTRKRTTAARTQLFASHGRGRLIKEALVRLSALRPLMHGCDVLMSGHTHVRYLDRRWWWEILL